MCDPRYYNNYIYKYNQGNLIKTQICIMCKMLNKINVLF